MAVSTNCKSEPEALFGAEARAALPLAQSVLLQRNEESSAASVLFPGSQQSD